MQFSPEFLASVARLHADDALAARKRTAAERLAEKNRHDQQNDHQHKQRARELAHDQRTMQIVATAKAVGNAAVARQLPHDVLFATRTHRWNKPVLRYSGWLLPMSPKGQAMGNFTGFFLQGSSGMFGYRVYGDPPPIYNGKPHVLRNKVVINTRDEYRVTGYGENDYTYVTKNIYGSETVAPIDDRTLGALSGYVVPLGSEPDGQKISFTHDDFSYMLARFALDNHLVTP